MKKLIKSWSEIPFEMVLHQITILAETYKEQFITEIAAMTESAAGCRCAVAYLQQKDGAK